MPQDVLTRTLLVLPFALAPMLSTFMISDPTDTSAVGQALSGQVTRVIDGDTLVINNEHIRLWGIDAPEITQTCLDRERKSYACGRKSLLALTTLANKKTVVCENKGKSWDRIVATCRIGDVDVASMMVSLGEAVDYPKYSHGAYSAEQDEARSKRLGLWIGWFDFPDVQRRRR